jgi:biopolymer transport protein TolQ
MITDMLLTMPCASAVSMMLKIDKPGLVIILLLFGGSIYAWSIMISKVIFLERARNESLAFLRRYRALKHPAGLYLDDSRRVSQVPLSAVYHQACAALEAVLDVQGIEAERLNAEEGLSHVPLSDRQLRSVQNAAERMVADQALLLESSVGYLASAANVAPFLGLLGTVMGVMNTFGSMAGSGAALLSEVAPGIGSALMTTVVGLIVALPSSIGYNILSDRVRQLTVMMDNFAQELVGDLERVHVS